MYISCKFNSKTLEVIYIQTELFLLSFPSLAMSRSSRLFYLPPSLLLPPICLLGAGGFRHFPPPLPSGMSLVQSCLVVRRPLAGWIKPVSLSAQPHLTTNLPCLDLGPLGWCVWGKGGDYQAPSKKSYD